MMANGTGMLFQNISAVDIAFLGGSNTLCWTIPENARCECEHVQLFFDMEQCLALPPQAKVPILPIRSRVP